MSKKSFVEIARQKMRGVVQIHVEGLREEDPQATLLPERTTIGNWSGSGFFINVPGEKGLILTNAHVIRNAEKIQVMSMLTSGERFHVDVLGIVKDLEPDVALLRLPPQELARFQKYAQEEITYLDMAKNFTPHRGTEVKAIGYPLGMVEPNITTGDITNFIASTRDSVERYVTDAAINPGNSGGPSVIETGEVIGLNTAIISDAENIGFITPIGFSDIILKNLLQSHDACFFDLGCVLQINSPLMANYLGQVEASGLIIAKLEPEGFAEMNGLKEMDVILSINGHRFDRHGNVHLKETTHDRNIFDIVKLIPIGKDVTIEFLRNKAIQTLTAKATPRVYLGTKTVPQYRDRSILQYQGLTLQELDLEIIGAFHEINLELHYRLVQYITPKRKHVVVTHVELGSIADQQEWLAGEVLKDINGAEIQTLKDVGDSLKKAEDEFLFTCSSGMRGIFT